MSPVSAKGEILLPLYTDMVTIAIAKIVNALWKNSSPLLMGSLAFLCLDGQNFNEA